MARPQNVYGCHFCSTRLWVSTEALKDRSAPVGIVCFNCKYAETYSLDSNSRFYDSTLSDHPKPANEGHLKTGQR